MTTHHSLLRIDIRRGPPETIIASLAGELDSDSSLELQDSLAEVVQTHQPTFLIIDLERLTFLDSAGIRTLVGFWQRARRRDARMTISTASPTAHQVLTITGLLDLFGLATPPHGAPGVRAAHAQVS